MKVTSDHWLEPVERQLLFGGAITSIRRIIVIHATCGATGRSSIEYWKSAGNGVCAHIVIERDGTIIQCRPFSRTCGHVRDVCRWRGFRNLNSCSIGIELANAMNDSGAYNWAKKQPNFRDADHDGFEDYPAAQVAACTEVCKVLVARYNLDDIVSHGSLDPDRRSDPGPEFDMRSLRLACGFPAAS